MLMFGRVGNGAILPISRRKKDLTAHVEPAPYGLKTVWWVTYVKPIDTLRCSIPLTIARDHGLPRW